MALKTLIPFPIFAPFFTTPTTTVTTTTTSQPPTEIRFSRWNNANADKFENPRRSQQQIEDDLRRLRRFNSALNITTLPPSTTATTTSNPSFKSTGTPSQPSRPSIPGKKSKYSKPNKNSTHPAFRTGPKRPKFPRNTDPGLGPDPGPGTDIRVGENGLTYVVPGAPFEYMYSYTETPKNVRPVGLREPAVTPFGPGTMPRPWTGRKPLPESKKKVPEFDSFNVPESGKKGVKHVQRPGPFLPGTGPRYVMSREEVLGEELTVEEVKELVDGCRKTKRQLNMGRDGLTHNMLDNIHAHWKRRRVCKIKCLGVCTVDMDNVCQQLEDKTGGKIIYRRGGVVYLFRGRNYNYKTRPRFPLMLWRPVTPIYPRLVKRVPEGLTLEEATDMRKRGRDLIPICKLGKNGVYVNLVKNVREAFEECELVRINCQGLNPSDCRKIGAKLKDLVPCVLVSFENEHILMWRGRDWKPSLPLAKDGEKGDSSSKSNSATSNGSVVDLDFEEEDDDKEEEDKSLLTMNISNQGISDEPPKLSDGLADDTAVGGVMEAEDGSSVKNDYLLDSVGSNTNSAIGSMEKETRLVNKFSHDVEPTSLSTVSGSDLDADVSEQSEPSPASCPTDSAADGELRSLSETSSPCTQSVADLLKLAVESGRAVILDGSSLDADMVYERSVAFAQVAPPGPVYRHQPQKAAVKKFEKQKTVDLKADWGEVKEEAVSDPVNKSNEKKLKDRKSTRIQKGKDFTQEFLDVVPQGTLEIDELAKLLA